MANKRSTTSKKIKSVIELNGTSVLKKENRNKKSSNNKEKTSSSSNPYYFHEIISIVVFTLSLIFFLSLISYSQNELPSWVSFSTKSDNYSIISSNTNYIGPVGTIIAGYSYFLFGFSSFLIPLILFWWSYQTMKGFRPFILRNICFLISLIIFASCILEYKLFDLSKVFIKDNIYKQSEKFVGYNFVGYKIGSKFLTKFFGSAGSVIISSLLYMISLIVVIGINPSHLITDIRNKINLLLKNYTNKGFVILLKNHNVKKPFQEGEGGHKNFSELNTYDVKKEKPKIIDSYKRNKNIYPINPPQGSIIDKSNQNNSFIYSNSLSKYKLPNLNLLNYRSEKISSLNQSELINQQKNIINTLDTFGLTVTPGDITRGTTITRYEFYPKPGLKISKITALQADIARITKAERINILAPIPGKDTVGIEIANSNRVPISIRELFEDSEFINSKARLPLALGRDVYGKTIIGDLASMPHLLVAGATGSGKSVCINSIVASLLYRFTPEELRFIMIDPKVVEMQIYNDLPHMVTPVVTDPKKVLICLRWVIKEMENRYELFSKVNTRNFEGYNAIQKEKSLNVKLKLSKKDELEEQTNFTSVDIENANKDSQDNKDNLPTSLPYIVVIIDELADLMQTAPSDVEMGIARIAQKARAAGIHLIVATQTPRADVVTGVIKANIPSRIAFQVSSKTDSRIILDYNGAENLLGKGDMLYLPPGSAQLIRSQGALITDEEAQNLVKSCSNQEGIEEFKSNSVCDIETDVLETNDVNEISDADEEIIEKCLEVIHSEKRASTSLLQRRLRLGYTRAARMIDILESRGIVGPGEGAKPREILVNLDDNVI